MGVKSLWELLGPVGRPVLLETMEGKALAIDSSIWIYQFQATMRDKEGRGLVNAPVLGFLRRISKLMFYGIKPVFVFDGGAPALKRSTLSERKRKKLGAAASHAKVAEKLLAAQLRRKAVEDAQAGPSGKGKARAEPVRIDDDTVYLEDLEPGRIPSPQKTPQAPPTSLPPNPISPTKHKWQDHDPYRLPELDFSASVAKATTSAAPDPRLATEDELRAFIEEMKPEDFDISSPEFRDLPTEVKYEIIGDLRLRSRQTSYQRLQQMLQAAPTPIDFSREQIKALSKRNALTMQLLETTGIISNAKDVIPTRVASERNRHYTLVRNEGPNGGWVLGRISDEGTILKPITLDGAGDEGQRVQSVLAENDDDDDDMEEVEIPVAAPMDSDLREYQRQNALEALDRRTKPLQRPRKGLDTRTRTVASQPYLLDEDVLPVLEPIDSDDHDTDMVQVLEESRIQAEEADLHQALERSRFDIPRILGESSRSSGSPVKPVHVTEGSFTTPTRLHTALAIAGAGPSSFRRTSGPQTNMSPPASTNTTRRLSQISPFNNLPIDDDDDFGTPTTLLLSTPMKSAAPPPPRAISPTNTPLARNQLSNQNTPAKSPVHNPPNIVMPSEESSTIHALPIHIPPQHSGDMSLTTKQRAPGRNSEIPTFDAPSMSVLNKTLEKSNQAQFGALLDDVDRINEDASINITDETLPSPSPPPMEQVHILADSEEDMEEVPVPRASSRQVSPLPHAVATSESTPDAPLTLPPLDDDSSDEDAVPWSRSPSPFDATSPVDVNDSEPKQSRAPIATADWDAAQEVDAPGEENEFARFVAEVKGRDLRQVQEEIDEEIRVLNQQKRAAMRDAEDVTGQTVAQIMMMLRLFGIPYMTAPMEAEAQCAALVELSLVDGIITDDSDVFLFGGLRVYKNMFNQSKTVECFLASDLVRELGLTRDTLVHLACLLGSDYIDGLPGVGPVVAMELLKEFPGEDGLHKFRDWWIRVQNGRDRPEESKTSFRKRFKKRFRETLFLADDWPNSAVRDAYYHPTVDSSQEPFKWGLPDLDALRAFLKAELGWGQAKVDDLLLPIIQKVSKRGQAAALNRQGNLNEFFDVTSGSGTAAPRKRQAYASKRLQQIVSDFRKQQKDNGAVPERESASPSPEVEEETPKPTKKRKSAKKDSQGEGQPKKMARGRDRSRGRGRGRGKTVTERNQGANEEEDEGSDDPKDEMVHPSSVPDRPLNKTLRPRPKARPAYRGAQETEDMTTAEDMTIAEDMR